MVELAYLDALLTTLKRHDVLTYKDGGEDILIQLSPKLPAFGEPEVGDGVHGPGGWKRSADLTE